MTRRKQLTGILESGPKTLPQIYTALGIKPGNASRVVADALQAGEVERSGVRRKRLYALPGCQRQAENELWKVWL